MSYRSTAESFDQFMKGSVWRDMLDELKLWLEDIHETMEDPAGILSTEALYRLQGNAETVRKLILMPEMIRDNILEDQERGKEG